MQRMTRKSNLKLVLSVIGMYITQLELNVGEDVDSHVDIYIDIYQKLLT